MPRTKTTRNPLGTILPVTEKRNGKKVTFYDARKRYTNAEGKPDQKFKRCLSYAEAATQLVNFKNEIDEELKKAKEKAETPKSPEEHTFSELVAYFKKEYVKAAVYNLKGKKITGYKQNLNAINTNLDLLDENFGTMIIKEITYEDLRRFQEKYSQDFTKHGDFPAVSTINGIMSRLRRLFNVAIQIYWLDVSPFKRGKSLIDKAGEEKRTRMLTFEEEDRLLKACEPGERTIEYKRHKKFTPEGTEEKLTATIFVDRSHLIPIIICALDTAMRAGEIFNMEWWQVDFKLNIIYLTREAAQKTKTGKKGYLPITKRLRKILLERYSYQEQGEKVFKKFDYKRSFNSARIEAGIEDLHFHDFRSTAATRMILAGNSESQVMKITRHTNLKIFIDHYTNVNVQNAQRIGSSLNNFLEKEASKGNAKVNEKNAASGKNDKAA